jgi:hypothetical protein
MSDTGVQSDSNISHSEKMLEHDPKYIALKCLSSMLNNYTKRSDDDIVSVNLSEIRPIWPQLGSEIQMQILRLMSPETLIEFRKAIGDKF